MECYCYGIWHNGFLAFDNCLRYGLDKKLWDMVFDEWIDLHGLFGDLCDSPLMELLWIRYLCVFGDGRFGISCVI